jgi:antitoxin component YwqK of YwqJK toxin-antitoxin module
MRDIIALVLLTFTLTQCKEKYQYPGKLEFKSFKIGDKVDTSNFKKHGNLYFPNYIDGWTMDNYDQLPEKYKGLPIAIWILKSDSSVGLTLLNDIVLNITVSYLTGKEKNEIVEILTKKFGAEASKRNYEEKHPLQSWITYWELQTWETKDVIVQIGNSDMRKPEDPIPTEIRWNLAYSDFILEGKIINDFKKILFSNKKDSLQYFKEINTYKNRAHPPENGLYVDYYENEKIKEKGNYKNGKKDGLWESWYDNGQKEDSAFYKNDELFSTRIMWYSNGQLQLESCWGKHFEKVGKWVRYREDGQIESISNFNDKGEELNGKLFEYFDNGKLKREMSYGIGKKSEDIMYNEQGKRIK